MEEDQVYFFQACLYLSNCLSGLRNNKLKIVTSPSHTTGNHSEILNSLYYLTHQFLFSTENQSKNLQRDYKSTLLGYVLGILFSNYRKEIKTTEQNYKIQSQRL